MRRVAAPFILRRTNSERTGRTGLRGFPSSHSAAAGLGRGMRQSPALLPLRNQRRATPHLSAPSEQRAPTCNQHQQLTDQSGPPSAARTPVHWLLPVSFSHFLHSQWFPWPSIRTKARPYSRAGSSCEHSDDTSAVTQPQAPPFP